MNLLKSAAIAASIALLTACGGGGSTPPANNNNPPPAAATTGTVTYWTANPALLPMTVTIDGMNIGAVTAVGNTGAATNVALRPPCGSNSTQAVSKVLTAGNHAELVNGAQLVGAGGILTITANTCLRIQVQ